MSTYEQKKTALINQLSDYQNRDTEIRLHKNTSNLFRHRKPLSRGIDVRRFNQVINIDTDQMIAEVEGMTTYETLVAECLKYHTLPMVVPELKTITVGGALAGGGIESSSFRYGLTYESMHEYEILLSNGNVITCQPNNEHKDLFYGFPMTFGTLGYALKIKLQLIPAKPFVKLTHLQFTNPSTYFKKLEELCFTHRQNLTSPVNFIDGVVFAPNEMILTLGEWVEHAPYTSNYKYMNIYYRSLQNRKEDYLTAHDYIWRWDSDWFWCSKFFYMQNPILRFLLGKWMLNSATYSRIRRFFGSNAIAKKLFEHMAGQNESVIQDVEIPISNAPAFLEFFQRDIGIKPIWICPTMPYQNNVTYDLYPMQPDTIFINFGFWDIVPTKQPDGYYNKLIEQKVRELNGFKSLYSNIYYTEEEFWSLFNKKVYDNLKQQYDPKYRLRTLYQKCADK